MKELLDSPGFVALISAAGALGVAYIANVVAKKRRTSKPRDRMETIFDGYEKLISQQQVEIERKGVVISSLENVVERLEQELTRTRELLNQAREELSTSREQNEELQMQLMDMKRDYKQHHPETKL